MSEYIVNFDSELGMSLAVACAGAGLAREQIVRCRDCKHGRKEGTLCMFFAAWEPIAGGDEYADIPAVIEPDGFCAWGERGGGDRD